MVVLRKNPKSFTYLTDALKYCKNNKDYVYVENNKNTNTINVFKVNFQSSSQKCLVLNCSSSDIDTYIIKGITAECSPNS